VNVVKGRILRVHRWGMTDVSTDKDDVERRRKMMLQSTENQRTVAIVAEAQIFVTRILKKLSILSCP
jgi:hypothetical protein